MTVEQAMRRVRYDGPVKLDADWRRTIPQRRTHCAVP
jgi:hypothetical protein